MSIEWKSEREKQKYLNFCKPYEKLNRETGRIYPKSVTIENLEKIGQNNYLQFNLHPAQRESLNKLITKYERVGEDQYKVVEVKQYNVMEVDFSEIEKREMVKLLAFNPDKEFGQMVERLSKTKFKTQLMLRVDGCITNWRRCHGNTINVSKIAKMKHWHRKDLKRKLYQERQLLNKAVFKNFIHDSAVFEVQK